jgi:hypothetical protein
VSIRRLSIFGSGCSASEPSEARPSYRQGQVPLTGFGAGLVELVAAQGGLACCLAGDPEGSADVCPGGSFGAGGVDHQICCGVQGVSGVSEPLEVLGGPLGAGAGRGQGVDGPGDPPPGVGAGGGAHRRIVNRCFRAGNRSPAAGRKCRFPAVDKPLAVVSNRKSGEWLAARLGDAPLISSYITGPARPRAVLAALTENANDPREAATSGGLDTTTG